jgi:hypothetical protein
VPTRRFNVRAAPHQLHVHAVWKDPTFSVLLGTKAPPARCFAPSLFASACAAPRNRDTFSIRLPAYSLLRFWLPVPNPVTSTRRPPASPLCSYVLSELVNGLLLPTLAALCRKVTLRRLYCSPPPPPPPPPPHLLYCSSHERFPSLSFLSQCPLFIALPAVARTWPRRRQPPPPPPTHPTSHQRRSPHDVAGAGILALGNCLPNTVHSALLGTALHCTPRHCTALHCTALLGTALHCTALHCTALQSPLTRRNPPLEQVISSVAVLKHAPSLGMSTILGNPLPPPPSRQFSPHPTQLTPPPPPRLVGSNLFGFGVGNCPTPYPYSLSPLKAAGRSPQPRSKSFSRHRPPAGCPVRRHRVRPNTKPPQTPPPPRTFIPSPGPPPPPPPSLVSYHAAPLARDFCFLVTALCSVVYSGCAQTLQTLKP